MFDGVGIPTARGTGSSGYVQRNKSMLSRKGEMESRQAANLNAEKPKLTDKRVPISNALKERERERQRILDELDEEEEEGAVAIGEDAGRKDQRFTNSRRG